MRLPARLVVAAIALAWLYVQQGGEIHIPTGADPAPAHQEARP